ncbi:V-type ATP synthase subunit I [Halorubrum sp. AJ67]|uniref:V-type ATP synthase subunit I n=1 Tax=Halorubrum sp. AJ67 TaxID=1173487 RepID=UPI0003DCFA7A|nr:V-type ATP synthase subunit I [Halorubrum sp. AJ67]CDK40601.1 V-type ATPase 116 kDa subunit [Halorubrum sp. AJ67]
MSRVSVTGSKRVIDDVIEAAYSHHSLHVTDYDERYEGFEPGTSLDGAETLNERLVTVRSLESILDVDEDDAEVARSLDDEELVAELDRVRERVNDLNDQRDELQNAIRDRQEEIDRMEPFAELGIDLAYLRGYDSVEVVVGEAKPGPVEAALEDAEGIDAFDVFVGGDVLAIVAKPSDPDAEGVVQDALVGVDIALLDVPDADASPDEYVAELEAEQADLRDELDAVETELESVKAEAAGFLLRAEEQLTIEAEKKEAPLSFATTENAFVAEGWVPTETYPDFEAAVADAVGDHAEVEELERASFTPDGDHHTESVDDDAGGAASADATADAETEEAVATDGGHAAHGTDDPPVVQDNGGAAGPFELLVQAFGRPKYSEFDPTLLVFLTFPAMFGFMIGDVGYGVLYAAIGAFMYTKFDGAFRELGSVAMWAGGFTILFGIYFGIDVFGYHAYQLLPGDVHWPVEGKGLSPADLNWALSFLVASVLFGIVHLNLGHILSFVSHYQQHDLKHALYEAGSWLLILNGAWIWIFSQQLPGPKPDFLYEAFGVLTFGVVSFETFPVPGVVGYAAIAAILLGLGLLAVGATPELAEALAPVVNVISYARIMAVLLAKGGMALAVNLLAFGAYIDEGGEGSFHFIFTNEHLHHVQETASEELVFAGITTAFDPASIGAVGVVALLGGIVVAVVGHIVVLLLGVTSAGIQAVRLEYVEFFGNFYEGGGREYLPFGRDRKYTRED